LRFGAVLGQDAAVIGALILAFNSAQNLFRLGVAQP